jgi:hypothetical protein
VHPDELNRGVNAGVQLLNLTRMRENNVAVRPKTPFFLSHFLSHFLSYFYLIQKPIGLSRQARDGHRKCCWKKRRFAQADFVALAQEGVEKRMTLFGKKTPLLRCFIPKIIILPRQARDKHRQSTQNGGFGFLRPPRRPGCLELSADTQA